jgi:hypothetical protein
MVDDEAVPSRAQQQRNLLPRTPSDHVVGGLVLAGVVGWAVAAHAGADSGAALLLPAAFATIAQKATGHWRAWHAEGVERAFVLETSAVSFYVGIAALVIVGLLQATSILPVVHAGWFVIGALFLDTTVRSFRESRYA